MARFQYVARSQQGIKRRGALEAVSLDAARRALNAQGLLPESITATGTRGARPRFGGGVREAEATAFLEDLAGLLQTGVTVDRALSLVASQTDAARLAEAARDMATMVHKGRSLAEALEGYKDYLGRLTPTLVKAAEAGGATAAALADIVRQRKEQARFRRALLGALFYPGLLVCMSMICLGVLTNYVAPQFVLVFEEFDKPLPAMLLLLLHAGSLGQAALLFGLPAVLLGWWMLFRGIGREPLRRRLDAAVLRVPFLRAFTMSMELSRYFRTMGLVLHGGIPLAQALPLCHGVLGNRALRQRFLQLPHDIRAGQPLSRFFQQERHIPRRVAARLRMAEEQGTLAEVCLDLGERLGESARAMLTRLTGMLEPAVILATGVVVGSAVFGMFQAVFSLTELGF